MQRNKKNQLQMGREINQPNLTQNSQSFRIFSRGHYNYISNVQKVRQTWRRYVEVQQYFYRWAMHPLRLQMGHASPEVTQKEKDQCAEQFHVT